MIRDHPLRWRSVDLVCAVFNPAATVGTPLVELPYEPVQRPLQAAITWALARGGRDPRLAFRIVTALLIVAATSPVITRGWAQACLTRLDTCPPELRAAVVTAAALSAGIAADFPLMHQLLEQAQAEPAPGDPLTSGLIRFLLASAYVVTAQPERAIGMARECGREAADRGIDVVVGFALATEARGWARAGDYAAARQPAMAAVEIARRVRNPALSADASYAAGEAIWCGEPETALRLIEDSLTLTRAGADDLEHGSVLTLAAVIRARTGDLPGALAALQEATEKHYADGNRALLGRTLHPAAAVLARLGEFEPAAVLSGAFAAHFPASISAMYETEQTATDQTQALVRDTLGEAAYNAALRRGAEMDDDEIVRYAVGEFQRVADLLAQPSVPA